MIAAWQVPIGIGQVQRRQTHPNRAKLMANAVDDAFQEWRIPASFVWKAGYRMIVNEKFGAGTQAQ